MRAAAFTALSFRAWLEKHHASKTEVWVKLRRVASPGSGIHYAQALDHALCFGWIDGVRRPIDRHSFATRFSPRRRGSIWSRINLGHYRRLEQQGLVAPAGRKVFADRDPKRSGLYSFESAPKALPPDYRRSFRAEAAAWTFFSAQAPWYRRTATFWVVSAKREETRRRRLAQLIADSAQGRRLRMLSPKGR